MKMPRHMYRTKIVVENVWKKWRRRHLGGHDLVRRMDRQGEVRIWCRKCSELREAKNGTETNELLQTGSRRAPKSMAKC